MTEKTLKKVDSELQSIAAEKGSSLVLFYISVGYTFFEPVRFSHDVLGLSDCMAAPCAISELRLFKWHYYNLWSVKSE